jgi:hypothetical protein
MKDPGRHTQQNTTNFDLQTAKRFAKNTAITRAIHRETLPPSLLKNVISVANVAGHPMSYCRFGVIVFFCIDLDVELSRSFHLWVGHLLLSHQMTFSRKSDIDYIHNGNSLL